MSVWICSRAILAWLLNLSTFPTVRSWNSGKFVINLGFITAIVIERHSFKLLQNARLIRESDLFEYCGCESPNLNKINTKANIFNIILCLRGKKWDLFLLRPDQAYPILWFCVICCPLFSRPVPPTLAEHFLSALGEPPVKRERTTNNLKSWNGTGLDTTSFCIQRQIYYVEILHITD